MLWFTAHKMPSAKMYNFSTHFKMCEMLLQCMISIKIWQKNSSFRHRTATLLLTHLENDLVWVDAIGQAESIAEVSLQLRDLADKWKELWVHSLLVLLPLLCNLVLLQMDTNTSVSTMTNGWTSWFNRMNVKYLGRVACLFFCVKDLALLVTGLPQPCLLEVGVSHSLGDLDTGNINLGVGGDDKLLVGPTQGDSVQGKRTCACVKNTFN